MRHLRRGGRRLVGAVGAFAAGFGAGQASDAAVIYTPVDVDIPDPMNDYHVDLNGDAIEEFDIQQFETVTKVIDVNAATAFVTDFGDDDRTANLAAGALIGPASTFSADGMAPSGGDPLNGTIDDDQDPNTPQVPAGHFQVSDGPGFIGVRFQIAGNTHYGYVGYEGIGEENDPTGHVYALGYEDVADTAIEAGAGIPAGLPGDYNGDNVVDAADYTVWRDNLGSDTSLPNDDTSGVDSDDYDRWQMHFGEELGVGSSGVMSGSAIPEPTSLCLLAAGAAGLPLYRRRRRT